MKTENLKLSKNEKEQLRLLAMKLIFGEKMQKQKVKEILGVSWTAITAWCKIYKKSGEKGLKASTNVGGRPRSENINLSK